MSTGQPIFVAGATGVIGRTLCRLLVQDGWRVTGTTRSADKASALRTLGVMPAIVDAFDAAALREALSASGARTVIHQLTDLPRVFDPARWAEAVERNARIRDIGTRNLVAAAVACGALRLVAQSIAFAYAPGAQPFAESAPLNVDADGPRGVSARGVASLESQVLGAPLVGIVLRYGRLYGPDTGADQPPKDAAVHVDAAADAARRAVTRGSGGVYNVAEQGGSVVTERARHELGWDAAFRVETSV